MNALSHSTRWITTGLIATTVLSLAAPAFAGSGRRYKNVYPAASAQRVVVHQHSSSAGPVLAGIVGGFILGAAIANSHPVVVHQPVYSHPVAAYRYYDPYNQIWFDSLDQCAYNHHYRGHSRLIHVIDVNSGRHVRTLRYGDGHWYRVAGRHSRHYHEDCG
jgi:hypothetical protein